jgi:hypothetical protein
LFVEVWELFTPWIWLVTSKNVIFFLLYLYNVTSNIRDFADSDFQNLELNGSPV